MWRTRSNPLKNTQYINKKDYNSLDSTDETDEENQVTAHFMDSNNNITDKTMKIDVRDVISWPCLGDCGYSKAECYLIEHNCQDWYCPEGYSLRNFECPSGMLRIKKRTKPDPCSNCGSRLELYRSHEDTKTMSIINDYSMSKN